jgi:hypothetical protein
MQVQPVQHEGQLKRTELRLSASGNTEYHLYSFSEPNILTVT